MLGRKWEGRSNRRIPVAKAIHPKYCVIIHFNSSREKIDVLTILEPSQSYGQRLVERGGGNISGLNKSEAMEMLGWAILEVLSCVRLVHFIRAARSCVRPCARPARAPLIRLLSSLST